MTQPFVSTTDLGNFLHQDVSSDELATIALDSACQAVRTYIGQHINYVDDDEVWLDGTGTDSLLLPEIPVLQVSSVTTYDRDGDDEHELLAEVDYRLSEGAGILWRLKAEVWPRGRHNIRVVYDHGWAVTEEQLAPGSGSGWQGHRAAERVPSDIRLVALSLAASTFLAGSVGLGGIKQEKIGDYSYTLAEDSQSAAGFLADNHRAMLEPYKQRRVA